MLGARDAVMVSPAPARRELSWVKYKYDIKQRPAVQDSVC